MFLFLVFLPTLSGASAIFHYYIYTCLFILTWCPDQVPTGVSVKFICFSCDHLINLWYNLARFFRFTAGCTVHGFSWHDPRYINYTIHTWLAADLRPHTCFYDFLPNCYNIKCKNYEFWKWTWINGLKHVNSLVHHVTAARHSSLLFSPSQNIGF